MRTCGDCTMCCKLLGVRATVFVRQDTLTAPLEPFPAKPKDEWCQYCNIGSGCRVYDTRPHACRTFECMWLQNETFPPMMRPDRSRSVFVESEMEELKQINIFVPLERGLNCYLDDPMLQRYIQMYMDHDFDVAIVCGEDRRILSTNQKRAAERLQAAQEKLRSLQQK